MTQSEVVSSRLRLTPMPVEALDALRAGDRSHLERVTAASFPEPLEPPPLTADVLEYFRDTLEADPAIAPWWVRLIVTRDSATAVGSIGFTGPPDGEGAVVLGYSIYPAFQRQGFAAEAATALVDWALLQPEVLRVQATIHPGHVASERVAAHAGLTRTNRIIDDPDEGPIAVWERLKGSS